MPFNYYLTATEQLLIQTTTERYVVNGPQTVFVGLGKSVQKRTALLLDQLEFVRVRDKLSGELRVETGPQLLFLGAWDEVTERGNADTLGKESVTYLLIEDTLTGQRYIKRGPCVFVPEPYERVVDRPRALSLKLDEYMCVKDVTTGRVWVERGQKLLFLEPHHRFLFPDPKKAISLTANEYVHLLNKITGKVRMEVGEQLIFPEDMEVILNGGKIMATSLKVYEYAKVLDTNTGEVRVERGEKLLFLQPSEKLMGKVCSAIEVDDETAVLVRDRSTGQQRLVDEKGLFFPDSSEEIVEIRDLVKLADYEVVILRNREGAFDFFHGAASSAGDRRAFFVPPYSEIVSLKWSRGRRRECRDMIIDRIDCRPQFMSFEFNCRTSDNVELVLEGTFFWQVVDVPLMVQTTGDTTGDVCNHARSRFIQLISKVDLQEFMNSFNEIAKEAHADDDMFYSSRGVKIHSLEVTGFHCANQSTAKILEEIVQETTNRLNRLSQQESENEVKMFRLKGDIDQAQLNGNLLSIQHNQRTNEAMTEGKAEAEKVLAFLEGLGESIPDTETKLDIWRALRKNDALNAVSSGSAHLYFTPNDCNLSIEHHNQ